MTIRFKIIVRILLLLLCCSLFNYLVFVTDLQVAPVLAMITLVIFCIELLNFINKLFVVIDKPLLALKNHDVSGSFSNFPSDKSFRSIKTNLIDLNKQISLLRKEKRAAELFTEQIIAHAASAMLCYNQSGEVVLMNKAFEEMSALPFLSDISQIEKFLPGFLGVLKEVEEKNNAFFSFKKEEKSIKIAIQHSVLVNEFGKIHILNIQDIGNQVAGIEVNSWQKLIRVLAHEIINTVTPIASLSATLYNKILKLEVEGHSPAFQKVSKGLLTISERSKGLISFVSNYRMFVTNPKLNISKFSVFAVLNRTINLLEETAAEKNIAFQLKGNKDLEIVADLELLEQVFINLCLNAIEATVPNKKMPIVLTLAVTPENTCRIRVIDEGMGMDEETQEKILTPFFTTKEKGSGIGLSLSRQIVLLHNGSINIFSEIGNGTAITVELPLDQTEN